MDVLVVDDEPLVRDIVADDLTHDGLEVSEAPTAEDALTIAAEAGPDGLHLFFALAPSGESLVRLVLRPQESGAVEGTVALADLGDPAALDFLILP